MKHLTLMQMLETHHTREKPSLFFKEIEKGKSLEISLKNVKGAKRYFTTTS